MRCARSSAKTSEVRVWWWPWEEGERGDIGDRGGISSVSLGGWSVSLGGWGASLMRDLAGLGGLVSVL